MDRHVRERILSERTEALARRGLQTDHALLPSRLVCLAGGRHVALPLGMVSAVRPFACSPVPLITARARGVVLGVSLTGRVLFSVLDLNRLLDPAQRDGDMTDGGKMLILRASEPPAALRVDRVLGVMRLRPTADPGRALLGEEDGETANPPLVSLLDADALLATIASLDHA